MAKLPKHAAGKELYELPDACLELVLAYLDSTADKQAASLVSRRWHTLHTNLRTTLRFVNSEDRAHLHATSIQSCTEQALQTWYSLASLTIEHRPWHSCVSAPDVSFLARNTSASLTRLTTLHLTNCRGVNDSFLIGLGLRGPLALMHLSVRHCYPGVSDRGVLSAACASPGLITLDLTGNSSEGLTDTGIEAVLRQSCVQLQKLRVTESRWVRGWGVRHGRELTHLSLRRCQVSAEGLEEGLLGATSLRYLNLCLCRPSKLSLSPVARFCPLLEELYLRGARLAREDEDIKSIVRGCPRLRVLDVSMCNNVGRACWYALADAATQLQELNVVECMMFDDGALEALRLGCPKLRLLRLDDSELSYEAIALFCEERPAVAVVCDEYDYPFCDDCELADT